MENFLADYFGDQKFQLEKLPGDGGHRLYTRLKSGQKKSYMLMFAGQEDQSLKNFVAVQKKLQTAQCFVPQIYKVDFSKGLLLLEDLGDEMLENLQKKAPKKAHPYYLKALKQMAHLQQQIELKPTDALFDKKFFLEEVDTAIDRMESLLKKSGQKKSHTEIHLLREGFKEEMEEIISKCVKNFFVYSHRDFHSRNLMIHKGEVYLLDFQDAGSGPWMYDLTSLLYDSYVTFSNSERQKFMDIYFKNLLPSFQKKIGQLSDLQFFVEMQFLQRGFKACGCFAGFYVNNQKGFHLKYIKPTLHNLYEVAVKLGYKKTAHYFKTLKEQLHLKIFDQTVKEHFF